MQDAKQQHQIMLEQLFNKNQLLPRIRKEFLDSEDYNFVGHIEHLGLTREFGIDLLSQMVLHKRTNLPTLIGTLRNHFSDAQQCADAILKAAVGDLVDWIPDLRMFVLKFDISQDVQEELDRFQFPLPMVVEPKEVTRNTQTGYLTSGGSIILRNNHHTDDVCLDHINRLNRIPLTINHHIATMVKNKWRNLDKPKDGETKQDFEKRQRAFAKYDRTAKDVIGLLQAEGNTFFLTHRYDKRGRTYCQGYHVSYQGAPWNKAVIEFADKEVTV